MKRSAFIKTSAAGLDGIQLLSSFLKNEKKFNLDQNSNNLITSKWVYYNTQSKLSYKTTECGDKIMDFSYAGYMGGGFSLPSPSVKITLSPTPGDI